MRLLDRVDEMLHKQILSNKPRMEFIYLFLLVYLALDAIIVAWFFLTPFLAASSNRLLFGLSMLAYNYGYLTSNCHQMPQRSLIFNGYQMPFCTRDTGVYVGCLIGGFLPLMGLRASKFIRSPLFLALSLAPLIVDGVTQTFLGLRESTNEVRLITGLLFGFGLVYFFASRIVEHSKGKVNPQVESKRMARISIFFIMVLLAVAYLAGDDYMTLGEAVAESGLNPTFTTYVSSRAMQTLTLDPYLGSYDDAVLAELRLQGQRCHGVWVIYEGDMLREGKYVYFSGGRGVFKLVGDVSST